MVAKGTSGLSLRCPSCGRSGGGEAGPTSKEPLLSSLPSSVLPALKKAGTVCYAGAGMYRVFHMASVQSYTGGFIFILPSPAVASCCQLPLRSSAHRLWGLLPFMGQEMSLLPPPSPWVLNACGGGVGGVQRELWRGEVGLQKGESHRPLSLCHHPALKLPPKLWSLQIGSAGPMGP